MLRPYSKCPLHVPTIASSNSGLEASAAELVGYLIRRQRWVVGKIMLPMCRRRFPHLEPFSEGHSARSAARSRAVGAFPDGKSVLMLAAARARLADGAKWGPRRYLDRNWPAEA